MTCEKPEIEVICKRFILIFPILLSLGTPKLFSQYHLDEDTSYQIGIGFGAGAEFGVSGVLPKVSIYRFNKKPKIENYFGAEFTPWIWGANIMSSDLLLGLKYKFVTFDTSVGFLWYINSEDSGDFKHVTINPKVGIHFGNIWLKFGPSFLVYKIYDPDPPKVLQPIKINGMNYNVEILIMQRI